MNGAPEVFTYLIGISLMILFARVFFTPLKAVLYVLSSSAIGVFCLIAINYFSPYLGFSIAINGVSIVVASLLGLPGVILLILLQLIGF